jgi:hypothetical protein
LKLIFVVCEKVITSKAAADSETHVEGSATVVEKPKTQIETSSDPTGNDRKSPKVEAVFRPEIFWIFSGEFLSISCAFRQEPVGISSEKIPKISGWNTASMKSPE